MSVVNGAALFHADAEKSGTKAERVMQVEIFWCPLISKMVLDLCMSVVNIIQPKQAGKYKKVAS